MNIILFGPPGVGKSTLIGYLKSKGLRAIDLEDVYPSRIRFQIPSMVDGVILGGADLNPQRKYPNTIKVLLSMEQAAYEARRSLRDSNNPGKAQQVHHTMMQWYKNGTYDKVIDASPTVGRVAQVIQRIMKGGS